MKIQILKEEGYEEALIGISLSYNAKLERMPERAVQLAKLDGGHNKFLESICVWLDITAPRYWWQQLDTYRIGVTKQSESTMHTLMKTPITKDLFTDKVLPEIVELLEGLRIKGEFDTLKENLPEGFFQRRILCTNYKSLRHMYWQRKSHKLKEWQIFCNFLENNLQFFNFLLKSKKGE